MFDVCGIVSEAEKHEPSRCAEPVTMKSFFKHNRDISIVAYLHTNYTYLYAYANIMRNDSADACIIMQDFNST